MEAMRQSEREVADLMVRMKNLDLSKVKIDDVFSFLQEILTYLSSNQEQWTHLTEFFENLNFFVSKDLNKCIQDFTEGVKDGDAVETLVKPALIVSGLCVQMCNCASIYLEVSKKFIMPAITTVPGNLSLSKEQVEVSFFKVIINTYEFARKEFLVCNKRV
uniref:Uncharacterized protein n=1 Tax=Panagrolaimus superbus TaxID=310955 RepID=A0A914YFF4_9BILA